MPFTIGLAPKVIVWRNKEFRVSWRHDADTEPQVQIEPDDPGFREEFTAFIKSGKPLIMLSMGRFRLPE